jgi:hypothetical protein
MKENVIIGRLIPAWRQYRKIHNQSIEEDYTDWEYFNPDDESVDLSEEHVEEVMSKMVEESNF